MYKVTMVLLTLAKEPHYSDDFTSLKLMHHLSTPRTRMCSPDHCSISFQFSPPLLPVRILWVAAAKGASPAGYMDTQNVCVLTPGPHMFEHLYDLWVSGIQSDLINTRRR